MRKQLKQSALGALAHDTQNMNVQQKTPNATRASKRVIGLEHAKANMRRVWARWAFRKSSSTKASFWANSLKQMLFKV